MRGRGERQLERAGEGRMLRIGEYSELRGEVGDEKRLRKRNGDRNWGGVRDN